ncbi:hypothetical protein ABD91_18190 [Lysinibacillus sphaericus]|uniref:hypothetical protein n=1 Tax=Lysinibacillus sphaericus TaxID=1421 RepID=UPI0018CEED04|nr:hypothetical protein [Lysinibacillus sphaericus]MBG9692708.1 hypothetical protein [Lysinibacillus sphaericus]
MLEECQVVNVDPVARTIRVKRLESNDMVSGEIQVFKHTTLPEIDAFVVCSFSGGKSYMLGELE